MTRKKNEESDAERRNDAKPKGEPVSKKQIENKSGKGKGKGTAPRSKQNLRRGGPGRPKGPNKATKEIRSIAKRLVEDELYQRNLLERLRAGTAGSVEVLLYHYAYGKPKDITEMLTVDPKTWTDAQLDAYVAGVPIAQVLAMGTTGRA